MKEGFDHRRFLGSLTHKPGVYRMMDAEERVLYVGKARDLRKRVASYFRSGLAPRTAALMQQVADIGITVTHTEAEALLLENNLIKAHQPRYNILLRDDKGYPWILLTEGDYPRLAFHRGARRERGRYFGPYPGAGAVRETIGLLQKLFRLRSCEDSFFANRSRPCLQYQIRRCTAPCVGYIAPADYAADVRLAVEFLDGRCDRVVTGMVERMNAAAERLEYESAARYRDLIDRLRQVSERQYVEGGGGDTDVIAVHAEGGMACVQVFFIRGGRNLGNRAFFPKVPEGMNEAETLTAFIGQYYLLHDVPPAVILGHEPDDAEALAGMLELRRGSKVAVSWSVRGDRARWLEMARQNAALALRARLAAGAGMRARLDALADLLELDESPERMECFDISHTQGEQAVAACVVFDREGPLKSDYRRFNIEGIRPGDDYAAIRQAVTRRYTRLRKGEAPLPDILFIDGGRGQVAQAVEVLSELQIEGVAVVGVAKGSDRRPGREVLVLSDPGRTPILRIPQDALHLIQQIRDEAHRFAITGHRQRRAKARNVSPLEAIPGLGPKRRQTLLTHFGGLRGVMRSGVDDLAKVNGISRQLARRIYDRFHEE